MKRRVDRPRGLSVLRRYARLLFAMGSMLIVLIGVGMLLRQGANYVNRLGALVFAPTAILIGALGLFISFFKPKIFAETVSKKRIRGWPVGRRRL